MAKALALIIEDHANLAMLYEDALRLVGYNIFAISDGLQALNYLATNDAPDLVILDVNLPHMSGRDIHKYIRTTDQYKETPVIILTANSLMLDQMRRDTTPNDYLYIKPIGMRELQELARSLLRGEDGKRTHMATTQKVPHLDEHESEDEKSANSLLKILNPDNTVVENVAAPVDPKAETQEHKAIITPDNEIIPTEDNEKGAG